MALGKSMDRRGFLLRAMAAAGVLTVGPRAFASINEATRAVHGWERLRAMNPQLIHALRAGLEPPDANGIRLPAGFSSRVVARTGQPPVAGGSYSWHRAPDGGATFATSDGGWIYVSNAEVGSAQGGCGALRFNAAGDVVDAYSILSGTSSNCAGGATPWGTWISCEETDSGHSWECDPYGVRPAVKRAALGTFKHEAIAVDPVAQRVYLTEDQSSGRFYRFTPAAYPDFGTGLLEVAEAVGADENVPRAVTWHAVPNPNPDLALGQTATRLQVAQSTVFKGGEGIYFHNGIVFFTTKGDNRVYAYDTRSGMIEIFYDDAWFAQPELTGVDNLIVDAKGFVYVAEDGGNLQLVLLAPEGQVLPFLQVVGQDSSEIAGPAFSPDGSRLYFSSQRGTTGQSSGGITYEISGPFYAGDMILQSGFEPRIAQ
ncbi:WD40 repeat protein [Tahibacter aquaticus]|uniref:WD40 repeat protein n=1 Tax=Tahibacter aquaticus TaxID=520092 RepID=A0A4V3DLW7_9GAMM|nr:alkaline phosphatase PhoX [Tahibacter aquaticus]TDR41672.1 WD40 repeat protein [Tahibacter aquaticus]